MVQKTKHKLEGAELPLKLGEKKKKISTQWQIKTLFVSDKWVTGYRDFSLLYLNVTTLRKTRSPRR